MFEIEEVPGGVIPIGTVTQKAVVIGTKTDLVLIISGLGKCGKAITTGA
jgi:hypothetical protein